MPRSLLTVLGATGATVGCAAMAASLPAGIAGLFGSVGTGGSGFLARVLGGAARPLFIASATLLFAGALACSRLVASLATVARVLLYLSMFELAHGGSGSMSMMTTSPGAARADAATFYPGATALLLSIALQVWRRRHGSCRPAFRLRRAH
jgi:hypothetical protein